MNAASFVDHLILRDLKRGQQLRREASALSVCQLAEKFDRTKFGIEQIIYGRSDADPETNRLVMECYREAQQLWQEFDLYTRAAIAERYGRTSNQVRRIAKQLENTEVAA